MISTALTIRRNSSILAQTFGYKIGSVELTNYILVPPMTQMNLTQQRVSQ